MKPCSLHACRSKRERGAALVAALCLILTAGMLVGSLAALSQVCALESAGMTGRGRSEYIAEGAAARIRFLIEADLEQFQERTPENADYSGDGHDRYLADGSEHVLDYYGREIRFTIEDGISGIPLGNGNALTVLQSNRTEETLVTDAVELASRRLGDYTDNDTSVQEDGLENGEYEALGMWNMPRNGALQYREELLWIPGIPELLPVDKDGRLSLVRNFLLPSGGAWSIYTVPYAILRTQGGMTPEQALHVLRAVKKWQIDRIPLAESLNEEELALARQFSWTESGYYTVRILQTDSERHPGARLLFTFGADGIAGPESKVAAFWEYFRY